MQFRQPCGILRSKRIAGGTSSPTKIFPIAEKRNAPILLHSKNQLFTHRLKVFSLVPKQSNNWTREKSLVGSLLFTTTKSLKHFIGIAHPVFFVLQMRFDSLNRLCTFRFVVVHFRETPLLRKGKRKPHYAVRSNIVHILEKNTLEGEQHNTQKLGCVLWYLLVQIIVNTVVDTYT